MEFSQIFVAVIMANICTLSFLAGVTRSIKNPKDKPAYFLVLIPCFFALVAALAASEAQGAAKGIHANGQSAQTAVSQ